VIPAISPSFGSGRYKCTDQPGRTQYGWNVDVGAAKGQGAPQQPDGSLVGQVVASLCVLIVKEYVSLFLCASALCEL
jgi:hypothetical protein